MLRRIAPAMDRHERLQKARRDKGYTTAVDAAAAFGWNKNTYISNENGNAGFSYSRAKDYAQAFGVRVEWLFDEKGPMRGREQMSVPIVGYVGANPSGEVLFATGQVTGDTVPPPPSGSLTARALEVRGHSMPFVAEDGSIIYFDDQRTVVPPELHGKVVVCELDTEEVLVKRLLRGSKPGLFDLESIGGPLRRDVRLRWVARVVTILPPDEARRLVQRGTEAA